jgi:hypothetical protein
MKLNIKRLQEGGGMPFVVYQPTPSLTTPDTSSAETTSSKSSKKSDTESDTPNLLSKEVINELIKKGLPNDVNQFLKDLQIAEKGSLMALDKGISGIDRNQLYSLASKANQLIHNSNLMESATKQAYDNDGLEELAVSTTGSLFVQDKSGKIAKLSMAEYNKKRDSVYAMTVNDLSKARMYNPNLAFDTEIISTIQNSMGINKINDYMLGILNKLGTETLNKEGYIDKQELGKKIAELSNGKNPTDAEIQGIKELASTYQTMGKDGIYKITRDSSSQRNHISAGYDYLWSMLPNNAKNVLKARYVVDGNEGSNPVNIIKNSFDLFTNESRKIGMDYPAGMNKEEGNGDGSGLSEKMYNQSSLQKLVNGDLDVHDNIQLYSADGADYGFKFKGTISSSLPTLDDKNQGPEVLSKALLSGVWGVIDKDNIYFGQNKLQLYDLEKVMYDGGMAANIWVPVMSDGKTPNYELLKNYQNGMDAIKKDGVTNPNQMNAIMEKSGAGFIKFDQNGKVSPISKSYLKPFLLIHGATTNGSTFTENNIYTHKLKDKHNDEYLKTLESIFKKNELTVPNPGFLTSTAVVQAPILIALSPSATNDAAALSGKGSLIPQNTVNRDMLLGKLSQTNTLPISSQYLQ